MNTFTTLLTPDEDPAIDVMLRHDFNAYFWEADPLVWYHYSPRERTPHQRHVLREWETTHHYLWLSKHYRISVASLVKREVERRLIADALHTFTTRS